MILTPETNSFILFPVMKTILNKLADLNGSVNVDLDDAPIIVGGFALAFTVLAVAFL